MNEQILELTGVAGFILYMLAYGLLQLGKITGQCYTYTLLNMLAASLVLGRVINYRMRPVAAENSTGKARGGKFGYSK